jgi:hypothetical protein
MTPRDRLARLHFVNTLLHRLTGHDLYLAEQMLAAIEAVHADETATARDTRKLDETLHELHESLLGGEPDAGFAFCDGAAEAAAGPLWVRAEVISALRRNAPYRQATVMVGNLPNSAARISHTRRSRAVERREQEHADQVAQLRDVAARSANPRSLVTLLFV